MSKAMDNWHLRGKKVTDMSKEELLEVVQHLANESVNAKNEVLQWELGYKRLPLIKVGDEYEQYGATEAAESRKDTQSRANHTVPSELAKGVEGSNK